MCSYVNTRNGCAVPVNSSKKTGNTLVVHFHEEIPAGRGQRPPKHIDRKALGISCVEAKGNVRCLVFWFFRSNCTNYSYGGVCYCCKTSLFNSTYVNTNEAKRPLVARVPRTLASKTKSVSQHPPQHPPSSHMFPLFPRHRTATPSAAP